GLVGLAQFIPLILLALPAGHVADRISRKHLLMAAQGMMALASLGLALISLFQGPIPLIYACLVLQGTGRGGDMPARWALLPQLVPLDVVSNAVAWNSSAWQLASMIGPALGGAVIALTGGAAWAYLLDAVCSLVVIGLTIPIRIRPSARTAEPI